MIRGMFVAAALVVGLSSVAALAQNAAIAERQQLMKGLSQAGRAPGAMLKGEQAFDLAAVQASLKTFAETAKKAPGLFPVGTETGNDTAALPKVWSDKADFDAKWAKFGADAEVAQASIKDEASFKANFTGVVRACGTCHETYRAKKN
jgi:cytochrome c556